MKKRGNGRSAGRRPGKWWLLVIVLIAGAAAFLYIKYAPSRERADLTAYYAASGDAALYLNGSQAAQTVLRRDDMFYVPADWAAAELVPRLYAEPETGGFLYTFPEGNAQILPDRTQLDVSGAQDAGAARQAGQRTAAAPLMITEGGTAYLSAELLTWLAPVEALSYTKPGRLYLRTQIPQEQANVTASEPVRVLGGVKSPILTDARAGDTVTVLQKYEDWACVQTADGHIGYMRRRHLSEAQPYPADLTAYLAPDYDRPAPMTGKVCLAWHSVSGPKTNATLEDRMKDVTGVNVISPTWFSLTGSDGEYTSAAESSYVDKAHELGLQVWIRLDDFDQENDLTASLRALSGREKLIASLVAETRRVGADGINLDMETVSSDSSAPFVQFMRELAVACHQAGLVLSVDDYADGSKLELCGISEQAVFADYVIVMGYDEYWRGTGAGPNASLPFTRRTLDRMLEKVPASKLIYALPLYTKVWTETPASEGEEGARRDGASVYPVYTLQLSAVGMEKGMALLEEHGVQAEWLEDLGQYYGEYYEGGSLVRIWAEELRSTQLKLAEVGASNIAGVAAWRLGLEDPKVWGLFEEYLAASP